MACPYNLTTHEWTQFFYKTLGGFLLCIGPYGSNCDPLESNDPKSQQSDLKIYIFEQMQLTEIQLTENELY